MQVAKSISLLVVVSLACGQTLTWKSVPEDRLTRRISAVPIKNQDRSARLEEMFKEVGCAGERLTRGRVTKHWNNIVCTLPGTSDEIIVVGAHYDHVDAGEGAIDNWSGSSLLPSLYESVAEQQRHFTYMFVGFAEEEKGLVGARAFVKDLGKERLPKVKAMINIDCVGMTEPKVWVARSDKQLTRMVGQIAAAAKIPVSGMNVDNVGNTDSHPFSEKKIPVLDIHSITTETFPILHTNQDSLRAVVMQHYFEAYRLLAATLIYVDLEFRP